MIGKAVSVLLKTALIAGASDFYANHFALVADHFDRPAEAYRIIEQAVGGLSRIFWLRARLGSMRAIQIENEISKLRLQLTSAHSDDELQRIRDAIFLAVQSRAVNPEVTILNTKNFQPLDIETLQLSLAQSDVVLEYVLSEPGS
jgi:hypothetical protein